MIRVKICGLTNLDDAMAALESGADYLGFIFYEKSPRHVTIDQVAAITARLPVNTPTVGVFLDAPLEVIYEARHRCNLKLVQLHGMESPLMVKAAGNAYKALRPSSVTEWEQLAAIYAPISARTGQGDDPTLLIDAYHPIMQGGTGLKVDQELALAAKFRTERLMLAGGLNPDNVGEIVQAVQPFAVDVSSGVEAMPGRKDHGKLQAFIQNSKDQ